MTIDIFGYPDLFATFILVSEFLCLKVRFASMNNQQLDVLIIDDVELVADAIATALTSMFGYNVDTAGCVTDALNKTEMKGAYSAVLLDFKMPATDPYEALLKLNRRNGGRTAIFSGVADPEAVARARAAGAVAFIPKDTPIAALGAIIGDIAAGKVISHDAAVQDQMYLQPGPETVLKARERRMLALLGEGLDLTAVSAALRVSPVIVSIDVRSVCNKLTSSDLDEAVRKARRLGLI